MEFRGLSGNVMGGMTTLTFSGMLGSSPVSGTVKKECWRKQKAEDQLEFESISVVE